MTIPEPLNEDDYHDIATRYIGVCDCDTGLDLIIKLKPHQGGVKPGMIQIQLHKDGTYTIDTSSVVCESCKRRYDEFANHKSGGK